MTGECGPLPSGAAPEATCEDLCWLGMWWLAHENKSDAAPPCPRCGRGEAHVTSRGELAWPCGRTMAITEKGEPGE